MLEIMLEIWNFIAIPLLATLLMSSVSFVLGTVVTDQYMSLILDFANNKERADEHRKTVRLWYYIGSTGGPITAVFLYYHWESKPGFFIGMITYVMACWIGWWLYSFLDRKTRDHVRQQKATFEYTYSCVASGVFSASSGGH